MSEPSAQQYGRPSGDPSGQAYSGTDNLETMAEAIRYNAFLTGLIRRAGGSALQGRVLDFGAGTGFFADRLAPEATGLCCVEPDAGLRAALADRGHAVCPDLAGLPADSQDYVYTLNVLEHIEDDAAAIAQIFRVLRPGGRLLVYVPAFDCLYTAMDRKVGHLRRYRRAMLRRRLAEAGFKVEGVRYADSLGFAATLAYRLFGNNDGGINRSALILYDRVVFPLSRLLDCLFQRWFGKNVFAVASKPPSRA